MSAGDFLFRRLAENYRDKPRILVHLIFPESLAIPDNLRYNRLAEPFALTTGGSAINIIKQTNAGVTFYACDHPVWQEVPHGFSTRLGGVSPAPWDSLNLGATRGDTTENVAENFRRFCVAIGAPEGPLAKNHQVHGTQVRSVAATDMEIPESAPTVDADGLVTDEPGITLTVFSADCLPILFYDPVRRCAAAVHAGWRGTAAGIAARAVEAMTDRYGCRVEHIRAAIGPGISKCCFETTGDVPEALLLHLGQAAEPCITDHHNGKFHVDLKLANRIWLENSGILPEHIAVCPACTACDRDDFWSHRLVGKNRGSMAAMICLPGREP